MRHLRRDIDIEFTLFECIELIGEGFPIPGQTIDHHHLWNIFNTLHQLDQHVALMRAARRKADTAIAHQNGRDTMV